ncbi:nuclear transport factor 2 family protein [Ningiella sp. W23]|uniref:nuclear transport factor 2 family protein n=1 Tax=Ningiella sp. W23 TaxID=3023715 RepID=UPI003756E588
MKQRSRNYLFIIFAMCLAVLSINANARHSHESRSVTQTKAHDEIVNLVNHFLNNVDSKDTHEQFWAEDLVYTSSNGERFGKGHIMSGFNASSQQESEATVAYSSEALEVRVFDKMALLTFTLVANSNDEITRYLNSGALAYRDGEWKVIQWQATRTASD